MSKEKLFEQLIELIDAEKRAQLAITMNRNCEFCRGLCRVDGICRYSGGCLRSGDPR